jgi:hypothetical protein
MFDLSSEEKRWTFAYRLLFTLAVIAVLGVFFLDYYYDNSSPLVANEGSGHIYPLFDKYHSRYVYLTKTQERIPPILVCVGAGSVLIGVIVDRKRKRLSARPNLND